MVIFFDGDADPEFCKGIIYCCGIRATLKCTNGEFSCSLGGQYTIEFTFCGNKASCWFVGGDDLT